MSKILIKEFAAKEKLEIVLSAPVQGEAGGRGGWGESFDKLRTSFRPPSPESSVRIFSNRHRKISEWVSGAKTGSRRRRGSGQKSPSLRDELGRDGCGELGGYQKKLKVLNRIKYRQISRNFFWRDMCQRDRIKIWKETL